MNSIKLIVYFYYNHLQYSPKILFKTDHYFTKITFVANSFKMVTIFGFLMPL